EGAGLIIPAVCADVAMHLGCQLLARGCPCRLAKQERNLDPAIDRDPRQHLGEYEVSRVATNLPDATIWSLPSIDDGANFGANASPKSVECFGCALAQQQVL